MNSNKNNKLAFSTNDAIQGYLPLMHELATRIQLVADACEGRLNLPNVYAREFSYLQFRYMCELIALGCLQFSGNLPQAQKQSTKKEWNAAKIMKILHKDHADAFPQQAERVQINNVFDIKCNTRPNALKLNEFKDLYFECGEVLHRGNILTNKPSCLFTEYDYQRILNWQSKIVDLMNEHFYPRENGLGYYLVSLRTTSGYPECTLINRNQTGVLGISQFTMSIKEKNSKNMKSKLPILY